MISRLWAGVVGVSLLIAAGGAIAHEVTPAAPVAVVSLAEVAPAAPLILAQYSEQDGSSSRGRVSGRGTRGLVKLGIFGAVMLFSGAMWVVRKLMS